LEQQKQASHITFLFFTVLIVFLFYTSVVEEIRDLIKLDEHQAMIIKDAEGNFRYFYGSAGKAGGEERRSFFLPPYATIVKLCWSRGRRREKRDLYIQFFDCRAQYMSFEFNCRTKDNVELVLEGTFFWEVIDLPRMVRTTGDTSGDICNHARSQFIKHVARVTLKEFMDDLNSISNKVYADDNDFYESRGVKVHSLEVTGYQCAEETTSAVLQQIIQETTNRMNRLSQQESENEVKIFKMQGTIEQEQLNGKLLAIQHEHSEKEAQVQGKAEADRVSAFITGLAKDVPKLEDRVAMWQTLRKTEALSVISEGKANLYFTPNDVNLSIEAKSA
jgi:regulator of protease activity HflC (stomatin/prohibitin superfamily)